MCRHKTPEKKRLPGEEQIMKNTRGSGTGLVLRAVILQGRQQTVKAAVCLTGDWLWCIESGEAMVREEVEDPEDSRY